MSETSIAMPTVYPVACHTDNIGPDSVFVAIKGDTYDGADFIPLALDKGASRVVLKRGTKLSSELRVRMKKENIKLCWVDDPRSELAYMSAFAAGLPAHRLIVLGVTGTKGKTTTTFLLAHMLETAGKKVAMLSGVKNRILGVDMPATLTTPHADYLQQFLALCVANEVEYVVMEVAAQAITLSRITAIPFSAILFTNFSHEHGEFYASDEDYFAAKCDLFKKVNKKNGVVLFNEDGPWRQTIIQRCVRDGITCVGFSMHESKDPLFAQGLLVSSREGIRGSVKIHGVETAYTVASSLVGEFNSYNILGAVAMAAMVSSAPEHVQEALRTFPGVPGRLEQHTLANGASCYIDYAHNPSSYQAVLSTLRAMTDHLIVVFGAGGSRDKAKRPVMGSIAVELADTVILTADNPRQEDPTAIIADICAGIVPELQHKVLQELDRATAIRTAYSLSRRGSIIALLGKGSDQYQIIGNTKEPFNEAQLIQECARGGIGATIKNLWS